MICFHSLFGVNTHHIKKLIKHIKLSFESLENLFLTFMFKGLGNDNGSRVHLCRLLVFGETQEQHSISSRLYSELVCLLSVQYTAA